MFEWSQVGYQLTGTITLWSKMVCKASEWKVNCTELSGPEKKIFVQWDMQVWQLWHATRLRVNPVNCTFPLHLAPGQVPANLICEGNIARGTTDPDVVLNPHWGTSRYFEVLLSTLRYFWVHWGTLSTLKYFWVLWGTSKYFAVLLGTLRYFYVR